VRKAIEEGGNHPNTFGRSREVKLGGIGTYVCHAVALGMKEEVVYEIRGGHYKGKVV